MMLSQEAAIIVVSGAVLTAINCSVDGWNGHGSVHEILNGWVLYPI
jgi:hypothetical protein